EVLLMRARAPPASRRPVLEEMQVVGGHVPILPGSTREGLPGVRRDRSRCHGRRSPPVASPLTTTSLAAGRCPMAAGLGLLLLNQACSPGSARASHGNVASVHLLRCGWRLHAPSGGSCQRRFSIGT